MAGEIRRMRVLTKYYLFLMCRVISLPGSFNFSFFSVTERFQFIAMEIKISLRKSLAPPWCSLISMHTVLRPKWPKLMQEIFVPLLFPFSLLDLDLWWSSSVCIGSSFPECKYAVLSTHIPAACPMSWVPAAPESSIWGKKLHFSDIMGILLQTIWLFGWTDC